MQIYSVLLATGKRKMPFFWEEGGEATIKANCRKCDCNFAHDAKSGMSEPLA